MSLSLRAVVLCFSFLVCVFLVLPSLIVVPMSFNADDFLRFPPQGYSTVWYKTFFGSHEWLQATFNSALVAVLTTIMATILGTLAAYGLVRGRVPFRNIFVIILLTPMIVPSIVTAVALYLSYAPLRLVGTVAGMVIAHTILVLPLVVLNVAAVMQRMDWSVERAARSLGASALRAFFSVTLPLIWPGIAAGATFAFIISFEEVVVSNYMYGSRIETLPIRMWSGLRLELNPVVAAVSTILIVLSAIGFCLLALARRQAR